MTPKETTFTHTDGRVFTYLGESPHITRDNRNIVLKVWETCCSHPHCTKRLIIKTATDNPWIWPNFRPAKFCDPHRTLARKEGQAQLVKARAEGLARWRESPQGKAALEQRAEDCMGRLERALYERACALSLTDEVVNWPDVLRPVLDTMPPPEEGHRDTRRQRLMRALDSLCFKHRLKYHKGTITVRR